MADPEWQTVIDKNGTLDRELGITEPPGFSVCDQLVPRADLNRLKALIPGAEKK